MTVLKRALVKLAAAGGQEDSFSDACSKKRAQGMFEITLGNWMPPCRALVENISEWYMLFNIMHKVFIGFALLAVKAQE